MPLDPVNVCRLCLVDDDVNIPIFGEAGDIRQLFVKIIACLPVNISKEDRLSQKICNQCLIRVEEFYEYWSSTADAEKQLLRCLDGDGDSEEDNYDHYKGLDGENIEDVESIEEKEMSNIIENDQESLTRNIRFKGEPDITPVHESDDISYSIPNIISNVMAQPILIPPMESNDNIDNSKKKKRKTSLPIRKRFYKQSVKHFTITRKLTKIIPPAPLDCLSIPTSSKLVVNPIGLSTLQSKSKVSKVRPTQKKQPLLLPATKKKQIEPSVLDTRILILANSEKISPQVMLSNHNSSIISDKSKINESYGKSQTEKLSSTLHNKTVNVAKKKKNISTLRTNGPYKCDQCDLIFQYQREVRVHTKEAHLKAHKFKCNECNLEFKSRTTLKDHHTRKHTNEYKFTCHDCGKKFKLKFDMYMHIQASHQDGNAVCQFCNRICRNQVALKQHIASLHNVRPYPCSRCKRRLATLESLEAHEKLHDRTIRVECDICRKTFKSVVTLKSHMTIHTGIKPYVCKVCEKSFRRQHIYKQHLLLHTDAKPYYCDVCGINFKQKPSLITHRKKHGSLPPLPAQSVDYAIKDLLDNVNPESTYYSSQTAMYDPNVTYDSSYNYF